MDDSDQLGGVVGPSNSTGGEAAEVVGLQPGDSGEGRLGSADGAEDGSEILSPAKIIRIGAMLKQLLEEVRNTSVDDAARDQLRSIYNSSIAELKSALSPDLGDELDALTFEFTNAEPPTESELRMAQAQLVGWLEGLFHGMQAMMMAQQLAARQQLEGLRGQLPEHSGGVQGPAPGPGYI